ncbi:hypothetical protein H0H92_006799 [Tricholoma furcatifolium]|nr:hypothetical protein H0H92_006799 [Tricholoma furcatifolium]
MGAFVSADNRKQKERSDAFDRQLQEDRKNYRRERKILLLELPPGLKDSGKSTILKQMKLFYQSGLSQKELEAYRPIVYDDLLHATRVVLLHMRKLGIKFQHLENEVLADRFLDHKARDLPKTLVFSRMDPRLIENGHTDEDVEREAESEDDATLSPEEEVEQVYMCAYDNHEKSTTPFLERMQSIVAPGYIPNETDILHTRWKTSAISEERFSFQSGLYSIRLIDAGELCAKSRRWLHYFEDAKCIVFCVALSDYDEVLPEDESKTRLTKSLELYESMATSSSFIRTPIVLLLNKFDVFEAKLAKVPLETYFKDYSGGTNVNSAVEYIKNRFLQMRKIDNPYWETETTPIVTQATDTERMRSIFTAELEPAILRQTLARVVCFT